MARQRAAVAERTPDLLPLWDALAEATRALAARPWRHEDRPHRRRAPRRARRPPAGGRDHRASSRPWAPSTRATSRSSPRPREPDLVVVSLFVNPTQFNEAGDLAAYPRDEAADADPGRAAGADLLFAPRPRRGLPPRASPPLSVAGVTEGLEGAHRGRAHFDGVATVVLKLLNMAGPDVAYFGQKDAQQAAVIRRLVADLDVPTRIEVIPTSARRTGWRCPPATSA